MYLDWFRYVIGSGDVERFVAILFEATPDNYSSYKRGGTVGKLAAI